MTASAENFLRTATASASFLRLPLETRATITAHAQRFGQASTPPGITPEYQTALREAAAEKGSPLNFFDRVKVGKPFGFGLREVQAIGWKQFERIEGATMTSTTNRSVPAGTLTREAFDKLSHPERNQFIRAGGKLTESPREKNHFAAFQKSRATA